MHYLESQGMKILERNFRCRTGEIDLIARDGTCLVFVEVKYRTTDRYGSPLEADPQGGGGLSAYQKADRL